jgi:hypothetical protein
LPQEGSGTACDSKYTACVCPDTYDKACTDTGQTGSDTACNNKYASCTCKTGYFDADTCQWMKLIVPL